MLQTWRRWCLFLGLMFHIAPQYEFVDLEYYVAIILIGFGCNLFNQE